MTHVCITGNETDPGALRQRVDEVIRSHARVLCELRLDYLDLSPAHAFSFLAKLPSDWAPRLVITQRLRASGLAAQGRCGWDVPTWQSWWKDVMALRPWFAVDLDWLVVDRITGESLSWQGTFRGRHAFFSLHGTLDEAENLGPELAASARKHNAGIKIAAPVRGPRCLARLMDLSDRLGEFPLKTFAAMGDAGRAWRWSPLAGDFSYFAFDESRTTAPGQHTFQDVKPYLTGRQRPDLYLLWSDDAGNRHGEKIWNSVFLARDAHARYVNVACTDVPESASDHESWARDALRWMERAGVRGASVTKPFKEVFPPLLGGFGSVNTLWRGEGGWKCASTDGEAVLRILGEGTRGSVAVLGGGGAAQAVMRALQAAGHSVTQYRRDAEGFLSRGNNESVVVSTWPGPYQERLVEELARWGSDSIKLCIDAQFSRRESESPLALWCRDHGVEYVPGTEWWRWQALGQDHLWFGENRPGARALARLWKLVPHSKSETIRALAIAAVRKGRTEIRHPSLCRDAEVFRAAIESLGVDVEDRDGAWWVAPAPLRAPQDPIPCDEGATGFRVLAALAPLLEGGVLRLDAAESLRRRSGSAEWPMKIPAAFPERVSVGLSSQFATGAAIAAAGWAGRHGGARSFVLDGVLRSAPYFSLTCSMLTAAGACVTKSGDRVEVSVGAGWKEGWITEIRPDPSSLAFLEVAARGMGGRLMPKEPDAAGDSEFPLLLDEWLQSGGEVDLGHHPDLAPPFLAAAAVLRRPLLVKGAPQLRHKESDRVELLVAMARALGMETEALADGFRVSGAPCRAARIRTGGDHRIAMAAGVIGLSHAGVEVDDRACISKSFPLFWDALTLLREMFP
ncbi:MAG: hypothetical protein HUU37_03630 [Bdellovibrionales bacterium]|nr:hypothetical protein [Bdellovibrionales bacterium]